MAIGKIRMFAGAAVAGASLALSGMSMYPAAAAGSPVLGHWAPAAPVPGMSALTSTSSTVSAVSCAPSADCAIGGTYDDALGNPQAWVASGHAGAWSKATALPGSITTGGGHSAINAVSCTTGNYCVAVGETATNGSVDRATVDVDLGGTWQQAMILLGAGTSSSQALSVSCPSAGNCTVSGWYRDASNQRQAFVEDEVNGTWGLFHDVGEANPGGFAEVNSVSCQSPGNCNAAGEATILGGTPAAFFAAEVSGSWDQGDPIGRVVPTTGRSISCPASGDCVLTGTAIDDASGHIEVYFMELHGRFFSLPVFLLGIQALNVGGTALDNSVSCASDGNCVVVGHYTDNIGRWQPFIAEEKGGTWQNAMPVPGIAALDAGHFSDLQSVSCASPGNCAATGFYTDASGNGQVFTVDEVNGTWGSPARLPGQSSQGVFSPQSHVSCWSAGNCVTGGVVAASTGLQAIVSVESPTASATLATNTAMVKFGQEQAAQLAIRVKPETGGTPAGTVTIRAGQTTLAVVPLNRGKATWTFPPKKLPPGTYQLTATYASTNGYDPVTSAKKKFVVTK